MIRNGMKTNLVSHLKRLQVDENEMVCLKAIMALDPNVCGLPESAAELLIGEFLISRSSHPCVVSVARQSVQSALFAHLVSRFGQEEATTRFGHLLLLIASATVSKGSKN